MTENMPNWLMNHLLGITSNTVIVEFPPIKLILTTICVFSVYIKEQKNVQFHFIDFPVSHRH